MEILLLNPSKRMFQSQLNVFRIYCHKQSSCWQEEVLFTERIRFEIPEKHEPRIEMDQFEKTNRGKKIKMQKYSSDWRKFQK